jgi:hypothetical protein
MAFPAIKPDVAVIHALRADLEGNAQIGLNKALDEELSAAADTVIITAEEIFPQLDKADIVARLFGLWSTPADLSHVVSIDGENLLAYVEQVSDPASFESFIAGFPDF